MYQSVFAEPAAELLDFATIHALASECLMSIESTTLRMLTVVVLQICNSHMARRLLRLLTVRLPQDCFSDGWSGCFPYASTAHVCP